MRSILTEIVIMTIAITASPSPANAEDIPLITPGHERLHPERLQPSRVAFEQIVGAGDDAETVMYGINTIDRLPHDEVESLFITQMIMNSFATSTNELRLHGETLAPMWSDEASLETNGRIVTYYSADELITVVADPGVEATERRDPQAHPRFDMLEVGYVLASMDLATNEEFVLPVIDPRASQSFFMRLRVEGQKIVTDEDSTTYNATVLRWMGFGRLESALGEYDWTQAPVSRTYLVSSKSPHWLGLEVIPQDGNPRPPVVFQLMTADVAPIVSAQKGSRLLMDKDD